MSSFNILGVGTKFRPLLKTWISWQDNWWLDRLKMLDTWLVHTFVLNYFKWWSQCFMILLAVCFVQCFGSDEIPNCDESRHGMIVTRCKYFVAKWFSLLRISIACRKHNRAKPCNLPTTESPGAYVILCSNITCINSQWSHYYFTINGVLLFLLAMLCHCQLQ